MEVLTRDNAAVDGSDMGVGKTLVGVEVVRRLDLPTLVVAPKATIPGWNRTADAQGTGLDVLNYEMLRTGRTQYGVWRAPDLRHRDEWFQWNPAIKFLIVDEGHRCKGYQTKNSELLKAARRQKIRTLVMSATLAESPMEMDALGYLLGMHDSDAPPTLRNPAPHSFYQWALENGCATDPLRFAGGTEHMARINAVLYPQKGVRVRISELGDQFPETQITAELYDIEAPGRMDEIYSSMAEALAALKIRTDKYSNEALPIIAAQRQEVELLKVPLFVDLARDAEAQGMSVVLFVNFRHTLQEICKRLGTDCFIDGSQVGEKGAREREANRLRFQNDESRFCVAISEAGGVGIDLHDVTGKHPRLSLISPGFNAKTLRQVFGRVRRSGGRSKSLQRVIFAAGTIEEGIHRSVSSKLDNLDALNDGDLMPENLRLG